MASMLGLKSCRNVTAMGNVLSCRPSFATAGKTKSAPQKQQFRRRQKDAISRASARTFVPTTTVRDSLTAALFQVTNENEEKQNGASCLDERAVISKAWSRLQMLRLHAQGSWERAFLQSKLDAIAELERVSPELAKAADEIDYSLPPLHRRIPTDTPPETTKFPFSMTMGLGR